MYYRIGLSVFVCVLLISVLSCTGPEKVAEKPEMADKPEIADKPKIEAVSEAATTEDSEVIISFGDKQLTMERIKWMQPNIDDKNLSRLTKWWLENELLYAEAQRRGIANERKAKFLADIMSKKAFAQELRTDVQNSVIISKEMVLDYYEKNKDSDPRLKQRGSVSFSHVRTKTLAEAEAVLARVKGGEDIKALAKELSIDKDARRQGIVKNVRDYMLKRRFGSEFVKVIEAAKENEVIGPVKVRNDGYEVARIDEKIDAALLPLEKVEKQIRSKLERTSKNEAIKELMNSLNEQAAEKIVKSKRLIEAEKKFEKTVPNAQPPRRPGRPTPK